MLAKVLVVAIVWLSFSAVFHFGAWYANRNKVDDIRAAYFRGYSDGWVARSPGDENE
jgi:hypothetical protein